jgi:uncharacterized Rmd1/YagE family protein
MLIPVRAFAVSSTVQPKAAVEIFPPATDRVRVTKTLAIVRYAQSSWAVVHDFGVVVFVGVEGGECERVVKAFRALVREDSGRPPLEESFAVEIAPDEAPRVAFDRIVVPELDARVVGITSLVVAQSVAMEYYESDLDALVAALAERSRTLAREGRLHGSAREIMRFIGKGMTMRSEVVQTLSLLDSPGITWESEAMDRAYRELRTTFEIEERYLAIEHETRVVQEDLALLVDMVRQRRSFAVEIAVAIFVAVETLLFLGQILVSRH